MAGDDVFRACFKPFSPLWHFAFRLAQKEMRDIVKALALHIVEEPNMLYHLYRRPYFFARTARSGVLSRLARAKIGTGKMPSAKVGIPPVREEHFSVPYNHKLYCRGHHFAHKRHKRLSPRTLVHRPHFLKQ